MNDVNCVVVGAGVVGLAVASRLAAAGRSVLVLEAHDRIGSETSSRNSEVVHAGLYYPPGSLKAAMCRAGNRRLYAYAAERGIPIRRCGKLIVATVDIQRTKLHAIVSNAERCGVDDLRLIEGAEARAMEPALQCVAAVLSPSTGIVDSHALMQNYLADLEASGGQLVLNTRVLGGRCSSDGVVILTRDRSTGDSFEIAATTLLNAAGLGARDLALALDGFPADHVPAVTLAKGNYFSAPGRSPFGHLIYPVPADGGLGVHLTFDLGGQMRFGPDVEWIDAVDYSVDPGRASSFYAEIRRYWPGLEDGSLSPAYCGIRAKLSGPGQPAEDFRIDGFDRHGCGGVINLFGIESPGLTSSLVIADRVAALVAGPQPT